MFPNFSKTSFEVYKGSSIVSPSFSSLSVIVSSVPSVSVVSSSGVSTSSFSCTTVSVLSSEVVSTVSSTLFQYCKTNHNFVLLKARLENYLGYMFEL